MSSWIVPIALESLIIIIMMVSALDIGIAVNTVSFGSFIRTTECESYVPAQMMEEKDYRGIMAYPRSQSINGRKLVFKSLLHLSSSLGLANIVEHVVSYATWLSTQRSPSLPFLLV